MDHDTYRAKILAFEEIFKLLGELKEVATDELEKKESLSTKIRYMLSHEDTTIPDIGVLLPVEKIQSLKNFDMFADSETLMAQAEAVKQEIIELSREFKSYSSSVIVDGKPGIYRNIDYIRNPDGKIVAPFDYWEDCLEVYLLKILRKLSNKKITELYVFKSSAASPGRQRERFVSECLVESERLMESVKNNAFPPKTLPAGKQPTMTNKKS